MAQNTQHHMAGGGKWDGPVIKLFHGKDPRLRQPQEKGVYFGHRRNRNPE